MNAYKERKRGNNPMKRDDAALLRDVQRNSKMAMKALDALSGKVYDDDFAMQLSRQSMKYAQINSEAAEKLAAGRSDTYKENVIEDMMLVGGIHTNTLLNTSTSHIAEMVIQGSNRGITDMCKSMNRHEHASRFTVELAKELMDFEEKNIEQLKKYL